MNESQERSEERRITMNGNLKYAILSSGKRFITQGWPDYSYNLFSELTYKYLLKIFAESIT